VLLAATLVMWRVWGFMLALILILLASLGFQMVTFGLLLAGKRMRFRKSGFFMQLGSLLIHAGFILFIMDFAMLHQTRWHLPAFWPPPRASASAAPSPSGPRRPAGAGPPPGAIRVTGDSRSGTDTLWRQQ